MPLGANPCKNKWMPVFNYMIYNDGEDLRQAAINFYDKEVTDVG